MADRTVLEKLLDGDEPRVLYTDVHGIFAALDGYQLFSEGNSRVWQHPLDGRVHLHDTGKPMYSSDVRRAAVQLQKVRDRGGFSGNKS